VLCEREKRTGGLLGVGDDIDKSGEATLLITTAETPTHTMTKQSTHTHTAHSAKLSKSNFKLIYLSTQQFRLSKNSTRRSICLRIHFKNYDFMRILTESRVFYSKITIFCHKFNLQIEFNIFKSA